MNQKHSRLAIKRLTEAIPGLEVRLLRQRVHYVLELKLGDRVRHMTMSVSPRDPDVFLARVVREAKQLMDAPQ